MNFKVIVERVVGWSEKWCVDVSWEGIPLVIYKSNNHFSGTYRVSRVIQNNIVLGSLPIVSQPGIAVYFVRSTDGARSALTVAFRTRSDVPLGLKCRETHQSIKDGFRTEERRRSEFEILRISRNAAAVGGRENVDHQKLQEGKLFETSQSLCQRVLGRWILIHRSSRCLSFTLQHVQTEPPTAKSLSTLITQVIQFQEDVLGKNSSKPPMTRVPTKCFLDFRPGGGLCHILATLFK